MATSRTGTSQWRTQRARALHTAQQNNQTHCPLCKTQLNYQQSLQPNSAEADHITEWAKGGTNTLENIRIICRQCNQKLGGKLGKKQQQKTRHKPHTPTTNIPTKTNW